MATAKKSPIGYTATVNGKDQTGVIRYYGKTKFKEGVWAGLELDTPSGKNDGSVAGVRYFTCEPNYGVFVPATTITILPKSKPAATPTKPALPRPESPAESPRAPATRTATPKAGSEAAARPATPKTTGTPTAKAATPKPTAESPAKAVTAKPATPKAEAAAPAVPALPAVPPLPEIDEKQKLAAEQAEKARLEQEAKKNEEKKAELAAYMSLKALETEIAQLKEEKAELLEWKADASAKLKNSAKEHAAALAAAKKLEEELQNKLKAAEKENSKIAANVQRDFEKKEKQYQKDLQALKDEIDELKDTIEDVNLDKSLAEETVATLEADLDAVRGKLQILEASSRSATSSSSEGANGNLEEENEKLKAAILKLRDLSLSEKQQAQKTIKELEKKASQVPILEEKLLTLETDLLQAEENVEELKEQLDAASEAEDLVQELNDKNMDLEAKVEELKIQIEDLEEMRELSEQLEEQQAYEEKQLRQQVHRQEIALLDLQTTADNLMKALNDKQQTILSFREKTSQLKEKLLHFEELDEENSIAALNLENRSQHLLDENLQLRTKLLEMDAIQLDGKVALLQQQQTQRKLDIFSSFVPVQVFQQDQNAVNCLLQVEQMYKKCVLLCEIIHAKYPKITDFLSPCSSLLVSFSAPNVPAIHDENALVLQLFRIVLHVMSLLQQISSALENSDSVVNWQQLGGIQYDILAQEHIVDDLLKLFKLNQFNETYQIDHWLKAQRILSAIVHQYQTMIPPVTRVQQAVQLVKTVLLDQQNILLEHQRLQYYLAIHLSMEHESRSSQLEALCKPSEFIERIKHIFEPCRKTLSLLKQHQRNTTIHDNEKAICNLNDLSTFAASVTELLHLLKRINQELQHNISDVDSDSQSVTELNALLQKMIHNISIDSKTTEHIAILDDQQAAIQGDTTSDAPVPIAAVSGSGWLFIEQSLTVLLRKIEQIYEDCQQWSSQIAIDQEGSTSTGAKEETAIAIRARSYYNEFLSLPQLKEQQEQLQLQLKQERSVIKKQEKTIAGNIRLQQALEEKIAAAKEKIKSLQEQLENSQQEAQRQNKSWEDALLSMQEDVDVLEREKSDLLERLNNASTSLGGSSTTPFGAISRGLDDATFAAAGGPGAVPFSVVNKEIQTLRSAIRYLQQQNAHLRSQQSAKQLREVLPPLPVSITAAKATASGNQSRVLKSETQTLRNQLVQLTNRLQALRCSPKVISLTDAAASDIQRVDRLAEITLLSNKVTQLQNQIQSHANKSLPIGISPLAQAASSAAHQTLLAKLTVPVPSQLQALLPATVRSQQLSVSPNDLTKLHSVVLLGY